MTDEKEMNAESMGLNNELVNLQRELAKKNAELERLSMTDPLTGVLNRRGFFKSGEMDFRRALRYSRPLAVLLADVDRFKAVNDARGLATGDAVLSALAGRLRQAVRTTDSVCRSGGEEFLALLYETDLAGALIVAERVRRSVEGEAFQTEAGPVPTTVSVGVAALDPGCSSLAEFVGRADAAMFEAKESGGNAVRPWRRPEAGKD
jgi:diguanylate cyclase (GGDEF)-like protein